MMASTASCAFTASCGKLAVQRTGWTGSSDHDLREGSRRWHDYATWIPLRNSRLREGAQAGPARPPRRRTSRRC